MVAKAFFSPLSLGALALALLLAVDGPAQAAPSDPAFHAASASPGKSTVAAAPTRQKARKRDRTRGDAPPPRRVSGYLDSHGDSVTDADLTPQGRSTDRDTRAERRARRERAIANNAQLEALQEAQILVYTSHQEAMRLREIYDYLRMMTPRTISQEFPDGGHASALRDAAIAYNAAVVAFYEAESAVTQRMAALTNGHALSGTARDELGALLGQ